LTIAITSFFLLGLGIAIAPMAFSQQSSVITPGPVRIGGGITPMVRIGSAQTITPNQPIAPASGVANVPQAIASPSPAPVATPASGIIDKVNYYTVKGDSADALANQMKRLGYQEPGADPAQDRFYGGTRYRPDYTLVTVQQGGNCTAAASTLTTTITKTLPQWPDAESASPILASQWKTFMEALVRHEEHHRQLGIQAHHEIRQILDTAVAPDCNAVTALVQQQVSDVMRRHQQLNQEIDDRTQHGILEGAVFPPA
jgi:predicted secreted Zn-dependent protease